MTEIHAAAPHLHRGQVGQHTLVQGKHLAVEPLPCPLLVEKAGIKRSVAQVLLQVASPVIADGINLRHIHASFR